MKLPNDVSRCAGEMPDPEEEGELYVCAMRQRCQRYIQRDAPGDRVVHAAMLCPEARDFHYLIPVEAEG